MECSFCKHQQHVSSMHLISDSSSTGSPAGCVICTNCLMAYTSYNGEHFRDGVVEFKGIDRFINPPDEALDVPVKVTDLIVSHPSTLAPFRIPVMPNFFISNKISVTLSVDKGLHKVTTMSNKEVAEERFTFNHEHLIEFHKRTQELQVLGVKVENLERELEERLKKIVGLQTDLALMRAENTRLKAKVYDCEHKED